MNIRKLKIFQTLAFSSGFTIVMIALNNLVLGAYAQDGYSAAANATINEFCVASAGGSDSFACSNNGFMIGWDQRETSFRPISDAGQSAGSWKVDATAYKSYQTLDGAKIAVYSIFNPSAAATTLVGEYSGFGSAKEAADFIARFERSIAARDVQLTIKTTSSGVNKFVAFSPSLDATQPALSEMLSSLALAQQPMKSIEFGIISSKMWVEQNIDGTVQMGGDRERVLSFTGPATFSVTAAD